MVWSGLPRRHWLPELCQGHLPDLLTELFGLDLLKQRPHPLEKALLPNDEPGLLLWIANPLLVPGTVNQ